MYNKNSYQQHYLNPQFSSSSPTIQYSRANASVLDRNGNEILLHHGAHDLFNNHYLAAATTNNAPFLEAAALFNNLNQELETLNEAPSSMTCPKKQNVARKDRHSKIYTSQGPRDRRVRLSIGIARKFFDLQELLGFDKPSKTLDWLLSKSKAAIKELVQSKTLSSPTSECEEEEEGLSNGNSFGVVPDLKGKSIANKCKVSSSSLSNLAKESRAKARDRARERTKEKMCMKLLNEATRNHLEVSGSNHYPVTCFGATDQDLIEEIKKKLMKQQMHNANENWDYSNFVDQSNQLCAILDQHKFIN